MTIAAAFRALQSLPAQAEQGDQPDIDATVAGYDAHHRALSATVVASGGSPLRRMQGPGVPRRVSVAPDGTGATLLWVGRGGLLSSTPELRHPHQATAAEIGHALLTPGEVAVPVDRAAVRAVTNLLRKSPDQFRSLQRQVDLASKIPASSRLVVLSEALGRTFWPPAGAEPTPRTWAQAFRVRADHLGLVELLARVFDPAGILERQTSLDTKIAKYEDKAFEAAEAAYYGPVAAADAFAAVTLLSDLWSAHERIDPLLRARFVFTGDVVEVTPFELRGTLIACHTSEPFRLRPGVVLLTDPDDRAHEQFGIRLNSLGFDDGGLTAIFDSAPLTGNGSRSATSRGSKGYAKMVGALAAHATMLMTPQPFEATTKPVSRARWASAKGTDGLDTIRRDVPVDVLLAGTPMSDG